MAQRYRHIEQVRLRLEIILQLELVNPRPTGTGAAGELTGFLPKALYLGLEY